MPTIRIPPTSAKEGSLLADTHWNHLPWEIRFASFELKKIEVTCTAIQSVENGSPIESGEAEVEEWLDEGDQDSGINKLQSTSNCLCAMLPPLEVTPFGT